MVDPNTRQGKRTPVTLKIKFKSETLEQFIERYAVDVSQGGIFIRTKEPLAVGTQMRFEFQLRDASPLIAGEGTVVWTRENDPSRPAIAPGMGVRFDRLAEGSQTVLERILAEKAKQAPQRNAETTTKPPLFTDVPTKVAPLPVQEALLDSRSNFSDQGTPLPKPMPFHSDAEDFDEQAFEEATKVRALDELIAQTADGGHEAGMATAIIPPDELAARRIAAGARSDTALDPSPLQPPGTGPIGVAKTATPAPDRDSAPGLPSPPAAGPAPRLLDTTPSPRSVEVPPGEMGKTRLGFDAPRAQATGKASTSTPPPMAATPAAIAKRDSSPVVSPVAAVAAEPTSQTRRPTAPKQKSSSGPLVILLLVIVAAAGAGVWFFYLRPKAEEEARANQKPSPTPSPGSNAVVENGSNGSAKKPDVGSAGSATQPAGPVVDTVVGANVDNATVEVVGTNQKGPAPFTAKLEKDKDYKLRVSAPAFSTLEMDVKGGQDKVAAKLVGKPRVISVTSEPAGALIFVDNAATGSTTPHDVELTKAQAAKKSVQVMIKKSGFRAIVKTITLDAFQESDAQLVAKLDEKLTVQPIIRTPPPSPSPTPSPSPSPLDGSAGSASVPPPSPSPTPSPSPSPSATPAPVTPGTGGGSAAATKPAEPEPDFVKK